LSPLRLPFRHLGTRRSRRLKQAILGKGSPAGNGNRTAPPYAIAPLDLITPPSPDGMRRRGDQGSQSTPTAAVPWCSQV